jgi:hypothetical protein
VYCADYRCSHSIAVSTDRWPDDAVRHRAAGHLHQLRELEADWMYGALVYVDRERRIAYAGLAYRGYCTAKVLSC